MILGINAILWCDHPIRPDGPERMIDAEISDVPDSSS